jgi:carbonic anhydrase/acetyltransferase-like protein (isoleucine patch superfamily)
VNSSEATANQARTAPACASDVKPTDPRQALQGFLLLDVIVRLFIWSTAFVLTTAAFTALVAWPERGLLDTDLRSAAQWGWRGAVWIILFNLIYVAELAVLRLPIPTPREGRYATNVRRPDRQVLWSCLVALLTKARLEAPFPGFLVFHLANLPPLRWLMEPIFGPKSRSCYVTDPRIIDPHLVSVGRNVVIGFGATVAGHYQERDAVVFKRTIIEDGVIVGGHVGIAGGAHIKPGAVIGAGSVVLPNTVVGANEFWWGVPARRVRDLGPLEQPAV